MIQNYDFHTTQPYKTPHNTTQNLQDGLFPALKYYILYYLHDIWSASDYIRFGLHYIGYGIIYIRQKAGGTEQGRIATAKEKREDAIKRNGARGV